MIALTPLEVIAPLSAETRDLMIEIRRGIMADLAPDCRWKETASGVVLDAFTISAREAWHSCEVEIARLERWPRELPEKP
jgi:hypothetical protein